MVRRPFPPLLQYTENDFCACERARRPWVRRRVTKTTKNTAPTSCPQNAPPALTSGRAAPSTVISPIRTYPMTCGACRRPGSGGQEWGWVRGINSHQLLARTAIFHTPACRPCIQCHPNNTYTQADERESIGWRQAVHTPHGAVIRQQHTTTHICTHTRRTSEGRRPADGPPALSASAAVYRERFLRM
jgi:hypothetical protein